MHKIIKNIHVFFLWLAWLAIIAHMIIPHDHHLVESFASQEESCPASNGNSEHHSGFPVHCHAFNDLASEKARPVHITQNIQYNIFAFSSLSNTFAFDSHFLCIKITDIRINILDSYFLELYHLRAPPSLS